MFNFVWCNIISIAIRINISNGGFYMFVNSVVWEDIVNESLFNVFKFSTEDCFGGKWEFGTIYF